MSGDERRVVIVTGGGRGIGAAVARLVGARRFPVLVNFVENRAAAEAVVRSIVEGRGRAMAVQGDIAREEDVLRLFGLAEREFGAIGGLVNNAAVTGGFARVEAIEALAVGTDDGCECVGKMHLFARGGAEDVCAARGRRRSHREYFFFGGADGWRGRVGALRGVEGSD